MCSVDCAIGMVFFDRVRTWPVWQAVRIMRLWGKKSIHLYLLSDEVWGVGSLHFEGAVVRPQVDRIGDARASALVDLGQLLASVQAMSRVTMLTISADSGPAMLNSRSAYFFQYPNSSGNLSRNRS
jgi:hypothetical protein